MTKAFRIAATVLLAAAAGCQDSGGADLRDAAPASLGDSVATMREVRSSLSGEPAPGAQTYTYRGFYAGMTRARLERRTVRPAPGDAPPCQTSLRNPREMTCVYQAVLEPDSALVRVEAVYAPASALASPPDEWVAREIAIVRELPLDVDGVRLARELSAAFERQTSLLDRRDASYGHHQAHVQMGTVRAAHTNYVELTVMPRLSREEMTVKMSRTGPASPRAGAR